MTMQTDLQSAVAKTTAAADKLHAVVHGDAVSTVETENGPVKTVAKTVADNEAEIAASRAELDQKVIDAAASAVSAAGSAGDAAGSAGEAAIHAAKIPDPALADSLKGIRVNLAGMAYELAPGGGDVVGPVGAEDGALARFDGATGKLLKEGGPVITADIADGAVTSAKIADGSIATAKIADDAVTLAKLAHGAADRFIGFDAGGVPIEKEVPPVDLTSRVAKTGDVMTGSLVGPEFKTSGSSSAATGFKIASGADLAAIFAAVGNVITDASGSGSGYGPVGRVSSVSLYKSGTTVMLAVGTACDCNCNC